MRRGTHSLLQLQAAAEDLLPLRGQVLRPAHPLQVRREDGGKVLQGGHGVNGCLIRQLLLYV